MQELTLDEMIGKRVRHVQRRPPRLGRRRSNRRDDGRKLLLLSGTNQFESRFRTSTFERGNQLTLRET